MKVLLLPGDGIGPEISRVVADVIACLNNKLDLGIELKEKDAGFKAAELKKAGFTCEALRKVRAGTSHLPRIN